MNLEQQVLVHTENPQKKKDIMSVSSGTIISFQILFF